MTSNELERSIQSIGKKSFVEDFQVYSNKDLNVYEKVKILSEKYSTSGSKIRVNFAERIFKQGRQREALQLIMKSPRLDSKTIEKAKKLYERIDS